MIGAGEEIFTGSGASLIPDLVADGSGVEIFTGAGAAQIADLLASGSGLEVFTGTGSAEIAVMSTTGIGIMHPEGSAVVLMPSLQTGTVTAYIWPARSRVHRVFDPGRSRGVH